MAIFRTAPFLFLALLLCAAPVAAQGVPRPASTIDVAELHKLEHHAMLEDPHAEYALGSLYLRGIGVDQDDAIGMRWVRRAAEQGLRAAQYVLGLGYLEGIGVARDDQAAATWLRRSAQQGHPEAMQRMAQLYEQGTGVTADKAQAEQWRRLPPRPERD